MVAHEDMSGMMLMRFAYLKAESDYLPDYIYSLEFPVVDGLHATRIRREKKLAVKLSSFTQAV
jgi:hypothetical protein